MVIVVVILRGLLWRPWVKLCRAYAVDKWYVAERTGMTMQLYVVSHFYKWTRKTWQSAAIVG